MRLSSLTVVAFLTACGASPAPAEHPVQPDDTPPTAEAPPDPRAAQASALCAELEPEIEHTRCAFSGDGVALAGGGRVDVIDAAGSRDDGTTQTAAYLVLERPGAERLTARVTLSEDNGGGGEWSEHELGELTLGEGTASLVYTVRDLVYACTGGPPECSEEESRQITNMGEYEYVFTCPLEPDPEYLYDDLCDRQER